MAKTQIFAAILAAAALSGINSYAAAPAKTATPVPSPAPTAKAAPAAKPAAKTVTMAKAPALTDENSWTMIVVPDTQTYIKQIENQGILDMMFAWIVRRRAEMNIQQVLITGDLVYSNDAQRVNQPKGVRYLRHGGLRDLVSEEQWKAMSRLMERLDGEVPYILCTGNHDYGYYSAENRNSFFNKYFPTDRNKLTRRQLVACKTNSFGIATLETSAYEFTAPAPDKRKFLVFTLPFAPTDKDLEWAKKIADEPRFANHFGIVLTHSYMYAKGDRIQKQDHYTLAKKGGRAGEEIFQKLIFPAKNIRLVVCGHVCSPDSWPHAVGFSMVKNSSGKNVGQLVFNTQAIGGGFSGNGGDGWLRILEFMPDRKTIKATTFSPFFYGSTSTQHLAWKDDERNCFTFELE